MKGNPSSGGFKEFVLISFFLCVSVAQISFAQGLDAKWESAGKQGVATAFSQNSKVWFTLQGGSLTEVFYPTADQANVQWLQFVVFDPARRKVETERDDARHQIRTLDAGSLSFEQINTNANWEIRKTYAIDPERDAVLVDVRFIPKKRGLELYLYYNPSLKNSGMKDAGWSDAGVLLSQEAEVFSAVAVAGGFAAVKSGFYGAGDGLEELRQAGKLSDASAARVADGNVAQLGKIKTPQSFTVALAFGRSAEAATATAQTSLRQGFPAVLRRYQAGWRNYTSSLPRVAAKYQRQFNYAAMVLRASEDKTFRGGNVASLSKPWITGNVANGPYVGGYHLVWSRDLYQVATAYLALGDRASANRALEYLFTKQQKPDGSYPQISWLDGRTLGDAIQMDEVSYPLILAYQLGRKDAATYAKHVKPTADYLVKNGPRTGQERWEEKPGYSPATIAAEIAGLVCAADIAEKNGDRASADVYLKTADEWARSVEKWTATTTGKYGDGNYYLRITQNGRPDAGEKIELNNNAGTADEREIVDAGFLELVRLGIKAPDDPLIVKSLKVVDEVLKVETPHGDAFFRYARDGYGEMPDGRPWNWDLKYTGKGHPWPLLSGERGQYELAVANSKLQIPNSKLKKSRSASKNNLESGIWNPEFAKARARLDAMLGFANDGLMIPEQVWEKPDGPFAFGEGAGSATPLAWSMAQFIRLALNLKAGRNLDTPEAVARRYGNWK